MRPYRLVVGVVAAAALYLVATHVARSAPADYTFHQIAFSGDTFDPFGFEVPVINNVGSVAFNASRNNGKSGIFRGNGGAFTAIAIEERFSRLALPPSTVPARWASKPAWRTSAAKASSAATAVRLPGLPARATRAILIS